MIHILSIFLAIILTVVALLAIVYAVMIIYALWLIMCEIFWHVTDYFLDWQSNSDLAKILKVNK